jgi:hypothetical protein
MAGQPKTRARREAARRASRENTDVGARSSSSGSENSIPDALPSRARAHDAREVQRGERSVAIPPRALRSPLIGAATRAAVDDVQADTMRKLAELIKPGVAIRIERVRPTWAAGWIEDYPTDGAGDALGELYEHLRDEHGGQLYRLTILAPGEQPLYVGAQAIAGPVRVSGRAMGRDAFEMATRPPVERAPSSAPDPFPIGSIVTALAGFLQTMMERQDKSAQMQLDAVRDMVRIGQKQGSDLAAAVLQVRADERESKGLASQVTELIEGMDAVEAVKKRFGGGNKSGREDDHTDPMNGVLAEAAKSFLGNVMSSTAARRASQPKPRRVVRRMPVSANVGEQTLGLPDAIPGQNARTN